MKGYKLKVDGSSKSNLGRLVLGLGRVVSNEKGDKGYLFYGKLVLETQSRKF